MCVSELINIYMVTFIYVNLCGKYNFMSVKCVHKMCLYLEKLVNGKVSLKSNHLEIQFC